MSTRMLIDARHSEETRVTVVKGSRVEEFDYESATRRQLKGNIYLARVTRVEPSLQAAFVEYGGNRHGFLAFSEIHPDYYQIPVEDREELIAAEVKAAETLVDDEHHHSEESPSANAEGDHEGDEAPDVKDSDEDEKDAEIEEAAARRRGLRALKRKYNIQEVIKRRQVLLVQVVKEERGNKGAALTTYLSLAGRYCVLMPNSTHAGGISRKISSATDRKRLKKMISDLEVPEEMGLIVRTAGMQRTKAEVKRDYEYLLRLWNGIRELTLQSVAPALVYEEGNLIKRTIRDLYTRDVDEILVEGENGYRAAKDFMKLLMPSHAKKVQHYKDRIPLFHRYQVESHLEAMYQPVVQLRSGGYIVINPTEALISIDVNSGRATREHNIEETALKTNMEAAEEVARQLRLRDMAGLVVIDFIDMEERNNNRAVERRMKDVLKFDRARIQVGRISSFGLMEMSRQRLRPNLLEASMETCSACAGMGVVRSVESASLMVLRQLEEEGIRGRSSIVRVTASPDVAIYLLNKKRAMLSDLETSYDFVIEVLSSPSMAPAEVEVTREATALGGKAEGPAESVAVKPDSAATAPLPLPAPVEPVEVEAAREEKPEDDKPRRKRRRRRRRRRGDEAGESATTQHAQTTDTEGESPDGDEASEASADGEMANKDDRPRRRRGSRGGRRRRERNDAPKPADDNSQQVEAGDAGAQPVEPSAAPEADAPTEEKKPRRRRRVVKKAEAESEQADQSTDTPVIDAVAQAAEVVAEDKPAPRRRTRKKAVAEDTAAAPEAAAVATDEKPEADEKPKRRTRRKAEPKVAGEATEPAEASETPVKKAPVRRRRTTKKADDTAPVTTDKAAAAEKPKEAPAKPASPKQSAPKPAPVDKPVQSIKVSADSNQAEASTAAPSDEDSGPKRKGWWQRTFG
ncbi:Rne/Rng family ribonuclease [Kordiimonas aestuarii]|uniref:Rne/Rng family ribonuclease n=1 Tax=Kordiimonas aestuarii TaxID=1005925 RepID=UPI0021D1329D|nr:ribonuclease E/G [Kordiimonas aestuarii]